jgi:phosphotransferase system IIA component
LNAKRSYIKSKIGYKNGDKHNSSVNSKGQKIIEFTKSNVQQEKKQSIKRVIIINRIIIITRKSIFITSDILGRGRSIEFYHLSTFLCHEACML